MLAQSFEVLPAVDVLEGRVVRLAGGRREAVTLEGGDPVALARRYVAQGAGRLHVVDLDGAFSGVPSLDLVTRLADAAGVPLQVGGGYRTLEAAEAAVAAGADRVMIGTAALDRAFLERAAKRLGPRLVVAIDVREGRVVVDGWTTASEVTTSALAAACLELGVERVLVTSTARDGSLAGPDLGLLEEVVATGLRVLAAGGVASLDDLRAVRDAGCEAAIAGSALLAGRFTLPEALAALSA